MAARFGFGFGSDGFFETVRVATVDGNVSDGVLRASVQIEAHESIARCTPNPSGGLERA
jgi:hypothetical protein